MRVFHGNVEPFPAVALQNREGDTIGGLDNGVGHGGFFRWNTVVFCRNRRSRRSEAMGGMMEISRREPICKQMRPRPTGLDSFRQAYDIFHVGGDSKKSQNGIKMGVETPKGIFFISKRQIVPR